jgi:hypothetical protein
MPKLAGSIVSTAYSPDKGLLAGVDSQGNIYLWSLLDGTRVAYFEEVTAYPGTLAFSLDGTQLYVSGGDGAFGAISTVGSASAETPADSMGAGEDVNAVPELSAQPYTHSKGSVSANLPMGWKLQEPSSLSFVSSDPKGRGIIAFSTVNTINPLNDEAFNNFIIGYESGLKTSITDYKEISSGIEAAKGTGFISKSATIVGIPYIFETYYDRDGATVRMTNFVTRTEIVESFLPLYQGVYASLKVDKAFVGTQMPYGELPTYKDKDGKYMYIIPGGWWLDPADPAGKYNAPDGSAFVQLFTMPWNEKTMPDDTAIFGSIQTTIEDQEGYVTILRRDKPEAGGWQITYSISGTRMTGVVTGIKVDGTMIMVNVEYPTDMAANYRLLASKINAGLKLP